MNEDCGYAVGDTVEMEWTPGWLKRLRIALARWIAGADVTVEITPRHYVVEEVCEGGEVVTIETLGKEPR